MKKIDEFILSLNTLPSYNVLSKEKNIFIFGAGTFAKELFNLLNNEGYTVKGFIVSDSTSNLSNNSSVFSWKQIQNKHCQIVLGIYNPNSNYKDLIQEIKNNGFDDIILPWELYSYFPNSMGHKYWLSTREFIIKNINKINKAYDLLEDYDSKKKMIDILLFRLGINIDYSSFIDKELCYFNDLSLSCLPDCISFVDGGAYIGDSYEQLIKLKPISDAFLFEPDFDNYQKLIENVDGKAQCLPIGLSDKYQIFSFNKSHSAASSISEKGDSHIAAACLDEMFPNHNINFIKLDIEGAERRAIYGSKKLINRCKPVMTISLYHYPDDIWEIPLLINTISDSYKMYIKQHSYNSFDSVLYAIPR